VSARFTVVLDDVLYRDLKIRAASEGVSLKELMDRSLRAYLALPAIEKPKFSWEAWDSWQREAAVLDAELGPAPDDLSDVKHYLYGYPRRGLGERKLHMLAEEAAEYNKP